MGVRVKGPQNGLLKKTISSAAFMAQAVIILKKFGGWKVERCPQKG